jgi:hypothetical protein
MLILSIFSKKILAITISDITIQILVQFLTKIKKNWYFFSEKEKVKIISANLELVQLQ